MSAYIVENRHVIYMVKAAISRSLADGDGGSITWGKYPDHKKIHCTANTEELLNICHMLQAENAKSYAARYKDQTPDFIPITAKEFNACFFVTFDPVQVMKAADCFDYQACEHDTWRESEGCQFIEALISKARHAVKGYDKAEWGCPKEYQPVKAPAYKPVSYRPVMALAE